MTRPPLATPPATSAICSGVASSFSCPQAAQATSSGSMNASGGSRPLLAVPAAGHDLAGRQRQRRRLVEAVLLGAGDEPLAPEGVADLGERRVDRGGERLREVVGAVHFAAVVGDLAAEDHVGARCRRTASSGVTLPVSSPAEAVTTLNAEPGT